MTKRMYYTVAVREDGVWCPHNGFYSRDDAKDEVRCLREGGMPVKAKDLKIVKTSPGQRAINAAIAILNSCPMGEGA